MRSTYIALDLETTGLSPVRDRILEIGAALIEDGQIKETYDQIINTGMEIPPRIRDLTGITEQMRLSGIRLEEAFARFLEFCGDYPILGHNISFDYSFLKQAACERDLPFEKEAIDTLKIARKILPDLPSRKLPDLCAYYGIDPGSSHRALDDALAAHQLYQKLWETKKEGQEAAFEPETVSYCAKKLCPITNSQKGYLNDLLKYHRIENNICIEELTKSEASRMIDRIILEYGRIVRKKG